MQYVKWAALGAAGVLVADMVSNMAAVQAMSSGTQKLVHYAAGGLTVALVHKFIV